MTADSTPKPASPGPRPAWAWARSVRGILVLSGVAFLIHLIPLFLPRNMPEQELAIARASSTAEERLPYLAPLKQHPKATPEDLREAAELLLDGAPDEAYQLALEAERRDPKAVETQLLLARICDVERMERCVRTSLERASKVAPGDVRPDVLSADLHEKNGDVDGAAVSLGRAHEKAPSDAVIGLRYARLLATAGHGDDARKVLERMTGQVPRGRLLVEQGLIRAKEGQDREAVALLQSAVTEDPRLALGHYELGLAWFRMGNAEAAEQALRQADRMDPADYRPLASLCAMQVKNGHIDDARLTRMDLERRFSQRMDVVRAACRLP